VAADVLELPGTTPTGLGGYLAGNDSALNSANCRVNVMGGLRYHDRKRLCYFVEKGNALSFFEQLEKLNAFIEKNGQSKAIQPNSMSE
jgi:hypothetical protein